MNTVICVRRFCFDYFLRIRGGRYTVFGRDIYIILRGIFAPSMTKRARRQVSAVFFCAL